MESRDWHTTQKWVSMNVPWKPEFEEKFRAVLTKESPLVLVLSQLDDRYFKGLTGQYWFDLQFRVHELGSVDEDDYIVRSHGNHLLNRSVVVELKSLPAGIYSIFVKVNATRGCACCHPSVEEVLKNQCLAREENDKLAQVGMSYDYAHGKVASYIKQKDKVRKSQEKSKAREMAFAQQRRAWEKRHLARKLLRKQEAKNKMKLDERKVRLEAKAKLKRGTSGGDSSNKEDSENEHTGEGESEKADCDNEVCTCKKKGPVEEKCDVAISALGKVEKEKQPKAEAVIKEEVKAEVYEEAKLLKVDSEKGRHEIPSIADKSVQTEDLLGAIVPATIDAQDKNLSTLLPKTAKSDETGGVTVNITDETTSNPVEELSPNEDGTNIIAAATDDATQAGERVQDGAKSEVVNGSSVLKKASNPVDRQNVTLAVSENVNTVDAASDTVDTGGQAKHTAQAYALVQTPVSLESNTRLTERSLDTDISVWKPEPSLISESSLQASKMDSTSIESGSKVSGLNGNSLGVGIPGRKDESVQTDCISISSCSDPALDTPNYSSRANSPLEERGFIEASEPGLASSLQETVPTLDSSPRELVAEPQKKLLVYDSDGDSSDSPVSDFDEMFSDSDDDIPRPQPAVVKKPDATAKIDKKDEDDEDAKEEAKLPSPWNAVCIIGFRVYSKDAELRLTIYEGDEDEGAKKVAGPHQDRCATHEDTAGSEKIEDSEVISDLENIGRCAKGVELESSVKME